MTNERRRSIAAYRQEMDARYRLPATQRELLELSLLSVTKDDHRSKKSKWDSPGLKPRRCHNRRL